MADIANSLATAFDQAWGRFLGRLEGMGDEEYFGTPSRTAGRCAKTLTGDGGSTAMEGTEARPTPPIRLPSPRSPGASGTLG